MIRRSDLGALEVVNDCMQKSGKANTALSSLVNNMLLAV